MSARYEIIAEGVRQHGWTHGVELGILDGRTYLYLLEQCPKLNLFGVDVWDALPEFREGATKSGEKCRCQYCEETRKNRRLRSIQGHREYVLLESQRYGDRSVVFIGTTENAAGTILDKSRDFVFIDADHSTEGVIADIKAWRPKLKPNGWLIGHDWNMQSVREGVEYFYSDYRVGKGDDHVWWVRLGAGGAQ